MRKKKEDKPNDFPVIGQDKYTVKRIESKLPKQPKKKLTSEELDRLAAKQGAKRRVYKSVNLVNLHKELQKLNDDIKKYNDDCGNKELLESRLQGVINKLMRLEKDADGKNKAGKIQSKEISEKIKSISEVKLVDTSDDIKKKLLALKNQIKDSIENNSIVKARRISEPPFCSDCHSSLCKCFVYLSKPMIKSLSSNQYEIQFGKDWDDLAKVNYLKSKGLAKVNK